MGDDLAARAVGIFRSRLETLAALMARAEQQWTAQERVLADLAAARLAPDMHPLPYQIVFTCNQPREFVAWSKGETYAQPDPESLDWDDLKAHVTTTIESLAHVGTLPDEKRIEIPPMDAHLLLTAQRYVDEWLLPNFYFHLVTAYGLLRMSGVELGKADYMAHLIGDLRPNG